MRYEIDATIEFHTGTRRDKFTYDDVLFKSDEVVDFTLHSGIGENLRGLLEGCCGEEGLCGEGCLGDTEEDSRRGSGSAAFFEDALVFFFKSGEVDELVEEEIAVIGRVDSDLTEHLADDNFDVLIVDMDTVVSVRGLDVFNDSILDAYDTLGVEDILEVDRACRDGIACLENVAVLDQNVNAEGQLVFLDVAAVFGNKDGTLTVVVLDRDGTLGKREDSFSLRTTGFENFHDAGETLGNISGRRDTTGMEGTHCKLGTRLTD